MGFRCPRYKEQLVFFFWPLIVVDHLQETRASFIVLVSCGVDLSGCWAEVEGSAQLKELEYFNYINKLWIPYLSGWSDTTNLSRSYILHLRYRWRWKSVKLSIAPEFGSGRYDKKIGGFMLIQEANKPIFGSKSSFCIYFVEDQLCT